MNGRGNLWGRLDFLERIAPNPGHDKCAYASFVRE
jgi:hypothetical protein